jgi:hypothetical protein
MVLRLILERLCLYSVPDLKTREGSIPSTRSRRISAVSPPDLPILKTARGAGDHSLGVSDGESALLADALKKHQKLQVGILRSAGISWTCVRRWAMVEAQCTGKG